MALFACHFLRRPAILLLLTVLLVAPPLWTEPACAGPDEWKRGGREKADFGKARVDLSEIISGGPPRDGIPSIDAPKFEPVDAKLDLAPNEPVIEFEIAGDARAYPLRVLIWHEIVNDIIGDMPITITYCPLCKSAIVFDRRIGDRVLDFGTTGKLRHSDLVIYDRQTEASSWRLSRFRLVSTRAFSRSRRSS